MNDDVGAYLAARYRLLYAARPQPDRPELLAACQARGITVELLPTWRGRSRACDVGRWYVGGPQDAVPEELAHELGECWLLDNTALGIEYPPWEWRQETAHAVAGRFAEELGR